MTNNKNLDYYLSLPYSIELRELREDDEVSYFAKIVELPGCMTEGDTLDELWEMLTEAKRLWIETALEDGVVVPEPVDRRKYSGRFILRTPATLHEQLAVNAKAEGVSLNQYVVSALSKSVGMASSSMDSEINLATNPIKAYLSNIPWTVKVGGKEPSTSGSFCGV